MSKYWSDVETEQRLIELEKTINEEYSKAYEEIHARAEEYFSQLDEKIQAEAERAHVGTPQSLYSEEDWETYKRVQVEKGMGLRRLEADMAERMVQCDELASAYINDSLAGVYALNHNYEAYRINQCTGIAFNLVNEETIKNLMTGDKNVTEFKTTSIDPVRDYEWNSKQIQSALTQGILQGDSMQEIADRFLLVMKRDRASAMRNARTAVGSAQNAGRFDSMVKTHNRAKELGIDLDERKQWRCTHDARTRDSHADIDGELEEIDKPFSNGLMFPKDSDGAPAEVYNCRCTMRTVIKGINDEPVETYADWIQRMIDEGYDPQTDWQKERFGDYDKAIKRRKDRK